MHIVFKSSGLGNQFGGAPLSELALCNELAKKHSVTILCPAHRFENEFVEGSVNIRVCDFTKTDVIRALKSETFWLARLMRSADIFHINGHWMWTNYLLSTLCVRHSIPYVIHPRGMLIENYGRKKLKKLFNIAIGYHLVQKASAVIALSHFEVEGFKKYGLDPNKIFVVPNGIPLPTEIFSSSSSLKKNCFVYLGRLDPRKNLKLLIEGYGRYRKKGGTLPLKLVGPIEKGVLEGVSRAINKNILQEYVRIEPPLYGKEKGKLLSSARAVIYPAVDEAFGRVPFEAVAAGSLPVLPRESGGAEYLAPFFDWCFFDQGNAEGIAAALIATEKAEERAEKNILEAQLWMKNHLTWPLIAERVLDIYRQASRQARLEASSPAPTHPSVFLDDPRSSP